MNPLPHLATTLGLAAATATAFLALTVAGLFNSPTPIAIELAPEAIPSPVTAIDDDTYCQYCPHDDGVEL